MPLLAEYKKSLKMAEIEEPLDLFFYRPIAFLLVKAIYRLPITPNQITFLSLIAGLLSAWSFAQGAVSAFFVAGLWYATANVLDCADGMLARLQNSGTPFGRLVDGIADWILSVAIFVGVAIGLSQITGNPAYWWVAVAGGLTSALHAIIFDSHQQSYIAVVRGTSNQRSTELERTRQAVGDNQAWFGKRIGLRLYLSYMMFQERLRLPESPTQDIPPDLYRSANLRVMRWWTLLGATTNRTGLIVAALFGRPDVFCWLVAIPGNLFLIFILLWQRNIRRKTVQIVERLAVAGTTSSGTDHRISELEPGYDKDSSR